MESGCALSVALKTNTTLTQLSLYSNWLGDASGLGLAAVLSGRTWAWLDLSSNSFSLSTWDAIAKTVSKGAFDRVTGMPLHHQLQCCLKVVDLTRLQHLRSEPGMGGNIGIDPIPKAVRAEGPLTSEDARQLSTMTFHDSRSVISTAASSPFKTVAALREAWRTGQGCAFCTGVECCNTITTHEYEQGYSSHETDKTKTVCNLCSSTLSTSESCRLVCFAGSGRVRTATGSVLVESLLSGSRVWTPEGEAIVLCVVETLRPAIPLFAPSEGGPKLAGCHPLLINGEWQLACKACPPAGVCSKVFNFVLDKGHVIEVDGVWCSTLQHDVDDDWGNTMVALLQRTPGWLEGHVVLDMQQRVPHSVDAHAQQAALIRQTCSRPQALARKLTAAFVIELHSAAVAGSGMLSVFRTGPTAAIITGQLRYRCPPSGELPQLLDALCSAVRVAMEAWEAPFVAALASWGVCYLHLFSDGNGRTARGLAFALLTQAGLTPVTNEALDKFHSLHRMRETRTRYCDALQSITDSLEGVAVTAEGVHSGAVVDTMFTPLSAIIVEMAAEVVRFAAESHADAQQHY